MKIGIFFQKIPDQPFTSRNITTSDPYQCLIDRLVYFGIETRNEMLRFGMFRFFQRIMLGLTVIEAAFALRITDIGTALGADKLIVIDRTGALAFGF
jgi:hypothetical protein